MFARATAHFREMLKILENRFLADFRDFILAIMKKNAKFIASDTVSTVFNNKKLSHAHAKY